MRRTLRKYHKAPWPHALNKSVALYVCLDTTERDTDYHQKSNRFFRVFTCTEFL